MSTHLPLRSYRPLHRQCLVQASSIRYFSSTQNNLARGPRAAQRRVDPVVAATTSRQQQGKASNALQEAQLSDERNVPEDIGLIPGNLLFPFDTREVRSLTQSRYLRSRTAVPFDAVFYHRTLVVRVEMD